MPYIIGIDLGTTNSVVACMEGRRSQVMQNAEGHKTTPSVVLYPAGDDPIVGEHAKRQRLISPDRTVFSVKRFVGCRWEESAERRQGIPYTLEPTPEGEVAVRIDDRLLMPEQIQAEILRKMKETAEEFLSEEVTQAVITCPAYFNDSQRQATKKAAELAGLEALRIINEPTAAALAYGIDKQENGTIAVFDFGGGTFDISILEIERDVFEVKSTCGDTNLGGDTIDGLIRSWLLGLIHEQTGLDLSNDSQALSRIGETAENVKCELSSLEKTTISLPFIASGPSGPCHFNGEMTRSELESLIHPILERLEAPCRQALEDAGVDPSQLTAVLLVGGSTRIPAVRQMVGRLFGHTPDHSVNADEAVAMGAAIQAGIMNGDLDEILLLDVTPLSLGIELSGGMFTSLIPRNSNIPTSARRKFTTVHDNQTTVTVHVMQGERKKAADNRTLSRFRLEGILPAPREVPEIEVCFTIDANGILNVAAMDLTSGSMQEVVVESYQPVFTSDSERMINEANELANEDRQFMRKAAIRNRLEEVREEFEALRANKHGAAITEDQEQRLIQAIFRLDVALSQEDFAIIESAERELKSVFSEIVMLVNHASSAALGAAEELIFEVETSDKREDGASRPRPPEPEPEPEAENEMSPTTDELGEE